MAISADGEQPKEEERFDASEVLDPEAAEEKVILMNRDDEGKAEEEAGGPREVAEAAVLQARGKLEDGREGVAELLERVADELRERTAGNAGGPVIERVARSMDSTAGYLHDHETAAIAGDLSSYAKLHAMRMVITAAFLGFLLGRLSR